MAFMKDLQPLVHALAQLAPADRARVMAEAVRSAQPDPTPAAFSIPLLKGGMEWIGGELRREDLYDDDGR